MYLEDQICRTVLGAEARDDVLGQAPLYHDPVSEPGVTEDSVHSLDALMEETGYTGDGRKGQGWRLLERSMLPTRPARVSAWDRIQSVRSHKTQASTSNYVVQSKVQWYILLLMRVGTL